MDSKPTLRLPAVFWRALSFLAAGIIFAHGTAVVAAPADAPPDQLSRDLNTVVDRTRSEHGLMALCVGVVRDAQVAALKCSGQTKLFGELATPQTIFQVASLGKPVVAYSALRWSLDEGPRLDEPLEQSLDRPWLGVQAPDPRARVTLRQILSHSSGLGNGFDQTQPIPEFLPGSRFQYSGVGFDYLQHVIESASSQSLDSFVAERVFTPLGLASARFDAGQARDDQVAIGHLPAILFVGLPFGVVILLAVSGLALVSAVIRMRTGLWLGLTPWSAWFALGLSAIAAIGAIRLFGGPVLGASIAIAVALCIVLFAGLVALAHRLLAVLKGAQKSGRSRYPVIAAGGALIIFSVLPAVQVPVAPMQPPGGAAAYSLMISTEDYAGFVSELVSKTPQDPTVQQLLFKPQIDTGTGVTWALGLASGEDLRGMSYFQWGKNPGYEALVVLYPASQEGVVVLTNGSGGADAARSLAGWLYDVRPHWALNR